MTAFEQAAQHSATPVTASGFGAGVMIDTADGQIPVDWIRPGDRVLTRDAGYQTVQWAGRTRGADLPRPVLINAGSLARSCPDHDLVLSPGHRVLLRSPIAELHFGAREVLASAANVALDNEVSQDDLPRDFAYYHFLLDGHHAVLGEGIWLESLFPDACTLAAFSDTARAEIEAITRRAPAKWKTTRMCLTAVEAMLVHSRSCIASRVMAA